MRTTVIPAQITTVEDTIAGNLTFNQIILLIMPVFFSMAIYALMPQRMSFSLYKIPIMIIIFLVFSLLATRYKGRIVAQWLVVLLVYSLRPHIYVYDKNTLTGRDWVKTEKTAKVKAVIKSTVKQPANLSPELERFDYTALVRDTALNLRLTKKGLLMLRAND